MQGVFVSQVTSTRGETEPVQASQPPRQVRGFKGRHMAACQRFIPSTYAPLQGEGPAPFRTGIPRIKEMNHAPKSKSLGL